MGGVALPHRGCSVATWAVSHCYMGGVALLHLGGSVATWAVWHCYTGGVALLQGRWRVCRIAAQGGVVAARAWSVAPFPSPFGVLSHRAPSPCGFLRGRRRSIGELR